MSWEQEKPRVFKAIAKLVGEVREQVSAEMAASIQAASAKLSGDVEQLAAAAEQAGKQLEKEAHVALSVLENIAFDLEHAPPTAVRECPSEHENTLVKRILEESAK